MNADEIRKLSDDEIQSRLLDTRDELMRLRFRYATGELTDFTQLRHSRRLIARLLTILNERAQDVALENEE